MIGSVVRIPAALILLLGGCATTTQELRREESVKPGINERWMSPDVDPLVATLERESREIYANQERLADLVAPRPGSDVADIGAGSGFMAELFADRVGPDGTVYAVDINPVMMDLVAERAHEKGIENLETVVCTQTSAELPPGSVDLVFICDTYHHFEYPQTTMQTIRDALRPGGQLVVVDFIRIEGVSRPFIMEHVRDGQDVFTREIEAAGFELVIVHETPFLEENYVLRFRRERP